MERDPAVYILASGFHGTLYIGVTSKPAPAYLSTPGRHLRRLYGRLWGEKNWRRDWKIALVEETNPTWRDLAEDFGFESLIKKVDPGSRPG
jgi:putative endonuclease